MAYVQLTSEERYLIEHLALNHVSHREIARRLKRHHTTVSRELARNSPVLADCVYWHQSAHQKALGFGDMGFGDRSFIITFRAS